MGAQQSTLYVSPNRQRQPLIAQYDDDSNQICHPRSSKCTRHNPFNLIATCFCPVTERDVSLSTKTGIASITLGLAGAAASTLFAVLGKLPPLYTFLAVITSALFLLLGLFCFISGCRAEHDDLDLCARAVGAEV